MKRKYFVSSIMYIYILIRTLLIPSSLALNYRQDFLINIAKKTLKTSDNYDGVDFPTSYTF